MIGTPANAADQNAKRYDLTKRASEIDPRAREHPEIEFVFTDAKGKIKDLQHAVVDTRVKSQGKLVIWLMGHNGGLFERISGYGLHGIQVSYANGWFGGIKKEQITNDHILGDIRLEAATGEDHSPLVNIPFADGMMERSLQFVKWLAKENPQGQWQQFISADGKELLWDKVIMAGISHGSTTAARFAMHKKVDRVVMLSGPRDNNQSWQDGPSATPAHCFFGFTHVLDGGWASDHYCRSWQLLKMHNHGPLITIDQSTPPYNNTRRLITNANVNNDAGRAHNAPVPGKDSPKDAEGKYLYEPVWFYLFNQPVDQFGPAVPLDTDCKMEIQSK
jgi:hypothetical protein